VFIWLGVQERAHVNAAVKFDKSRYMYWLSERQVWLLHGDAWSVLCCSFSNRNDCSVRRFYRLRVKWAMPRLSRLVAGLSSRRPGSIRVGFMVDKALGQVFLRLLRFPLSVSFRRGSAVIYHLGVNNRLPGGCISETSCHPIDMNNSIGLVRRSRESNLPRMCGVDILPRSLIGFM
jgi:hypothetical protein